MEGDHQNRVSDGHRRALGAAMPSDTAKQGREIGVLLRRHGPAGLTQVAAEKGAALARLATQTRAGALRIAGTHAGPGREVCRRWKLIPVEADFGQPPPGRHSVHARNRAEAGAVLPENEG